MHTLTHTHTHNKTTTKNACLSVSAETVSGNTEHLTAPVCRWRDSRGSDEVCFLGSCLSFVTSHRKAACVSVRPQPRFTQHLHRAQHSDSTHFLYYPSCESSAYRWAPSISTPTYTFFYCPFCPWPGIFIFSIGKVLHGFGSESWGSPYFSLCWVEVS